MDEADGSRGERLIVLFALVLLALVTLPQYASTKMYGWPWWAALRVLHLLPILGLVACVARPTACGGGGQWPRVFTWALVALTAVHIGSALLSAHRSESLSAALTPVAATAASVWLALALMREQKVGHRIASLVAWGGVVFACVSLTMWLTTSAIPMIQRNAALNAVAGVDAFKLSAHAFRNGAPLGHSNYTAGVALLVLPWVCLAAGRSARARRWGWTGGAALVFVTLVSTGSRGAVIGLAAGGGYALVVWARIVRWSTGRLLGLGALALIVLALFAMAVPRVRNSILEQFRGGEISAGDQQRVAMTQIGLAMGSDHWWRGVGPGVSTRLYPKYRHTVEGGVDMSLQLHSTPVQVWAETGLPGLLATTLLVGAALVTGLRVRPEERVRWVEGCQGAIVAAGVSFAGYAGFALTDYQFELPVIAALCAINLGFLLAAGSRPKPSSGESLGLSRRTKWALGGGGGAALLIAVLVSFPEWQARRIFSGAVARLEFDGAAEPFATEVLRASHWQPDNPHLLAGGAAAHLRMAFAAGGEAARQQHLAQASALLTQSLTVEPDLEIAHTNLGWILLPRDPVAAARHFAAALRLLPDRIGGYLGLGLALLEAGERERARDALALEIINDPAFLTSPAWDTPVLEAERESVIARAISLAEEFATRPAVVAANKRRYVHLLLRWWQGDDSVLAEMREVASPQAAEFLHDNGGTVTGVATQPGSDTPGWLILRTALDRPGERREILARGAFLRTAQPATAEELDILEAMLDRYRDDWRAWLKAPEGREAPWVKTYRRDRVAYPILVRNADIPAAWDAYLVQENRLIEQWFGEVLPVRGWAPDALLLAELDRIVP